MRKIPASWDVVTIFGPGVLLVAIALSAYVLEFTLSRGFSWKNTRNPKAREEHERINKDLNH